MPEQNGNHFADKIFKCIFMTEIIVVWLKFHIFSWRSKSWVNIGLGNGLAPRELQAISWINDDYVILCH